MAQAGSRRAPERFAPGSLTLSAPDSAAELAAAAGLGHTAAPANVVHRAPPPGKPGAAADPVIVGKSGKEGPLGEWAGPGKTGRVVRTRSVESWVNPATGDTVEIQTSWTLAEHAQVELKTDAVVQAERTIRVQLGRGPSVLMKSRGRSWFNADGLPNDPGAAVHVPSASAQHDGLIYVTDDSGTHLIDSMPHQHARGASLADQLAAEPMLAYDVAPKERVRHVEHFVSKTLPQLERNLADLAEANQEAGRAIEMLKVYIQAKLNYESPPDDALLRARWAIGLLRSVGGRLTGYEGKDTSRYVDALIVRLEKLTADAKKATPADKKLLDHAADLGKAVLSAGQNIALAAREIALMGRDWVLYRADTILKALGVEVDLVSGERCGPGPGGRQIGRRDLRGDGRGDGRRVGEGDRARLERRLLAGHEPERRARDRRGDRHRDRRGRDTRAGRQAGRAGGRQGRQGSEVDRGRGQTDGEPGPGPGPARQEGRRAASAEGRKALLNLQDTAQGLIDGLRDAVKVTDTGTGVTHLALDPGAIPQAGDPARADSSSAEGRRERGQDPARHGAGTVSRRRQAAREALRSGRNGERSPLHRRSPCSSWRRRGEYVAALDDALSSWARKLDDEVLAAVLRRSAAAVNTAELLGHVDWIMGRKGIKLEARQLLVRKAALSDAMDLAWLRELPPIFRTTCSSSWR